MIGCGVELLTKILVKVKFVISFVSSAIVMMDAEVLMIIDEYSWVQVVRGNVKHLKHVSQLFETMVGFHFSRD